MALAGKKVLVTGVSGFVGSALARHLQDEGASVFGLVVRRADGSTPPNIKRLGLERGMTLLEGDIRDVSSLAFALDRAQPDMVFHLAAQSFIPRSFTNPSETMETNCLGTANLLEAIRAKKMNPVVVFAGSSEEYGLVIFSEEQYRRSQKQCTVFPPPTRIPEVPVTEDNPFRPMSPYAVSKIYGEYLMRNYQAAYGLRTVVSRAFNHEGAGRGRMFVTSIITRQVMQLKRGDIDKLTIGNVNAFRDWSHVQDILAGYCLLAERGQPGEAYNQGSQRTNSVLTYLLLSLEGAGYRVERIETVKGGKVVEQPTQPDHSELFGLAFEKTKVDRQMLEGKLEFEPSDGGIIASTDQGKVTIEFDQERFRPADVPILLSNTAKIQSLGFRVKHSLRDIINDQLNHYLDASR